MPFRPDEFLDVAKKLQARQAPTGEARYRTIAGRSYYAAYLATCDAICTDHKFPPDSFLSHEMLSSTLAAYNADADVKKLGNLLHTLRLRRTHADYKRQRTLSEDESDDAVYDAEQILSLLPTLTGRLPRIEPQTRN